jgi:hypothetical protein
MNLPVSHLEVKLVELQLYVSMISDLDLVFINGLYSYPVAIKTQLILSTTKGGHNVAAPATEVVSNCMVIQVSVYLVVGWW